MNREIDAATKVCGLIGHPIGHSVSPVIHNNLADIYGQNLVYVGLPVSPGKLGEAVRGAEAFGFAGMNVTVPYKSDVIEFLKDIDPLAKQIGAVNTLVPCSGGYKGYNTDMPGLKRAMESDGIVLKNREVILIGAGGVARAVAFLLLASGAKSIYILNRTKEKAQTVADEVNAAAGRAFAAALPLDGYHSLPQDKKYLAIQCTNVGMYPKTEEAAIEDTAFYEMVGAGYDLIFNPMETRFMKLVKAAGGEAFCGLKMLLYQGVIAYELWNDVSVRDEDALKIYELMKKALGC